MLDAVVEILVVKVVSCQALEVFESVDLIALNYKYIGKKMKKK